VASSVINPVINRVFLSLIGVTTPNVKNRKLSVALYLNLKISEAALVYYT
jgi:hypothetical protein